MTSSAVCAALVAMMAALAACGDGEKGNSDTIWTGLSGVLIFGVLIVIAIRFYNKRSK